MNLEKVVFAFFIVFALTLNFGFFDRRHRQPGAPQRVRAVGRHGRQPDRHRADPGVGRQGAALAHGLFPRGLLRQLPRYHHRPGRDPRPFTDAQRLWATACIYGTAIARLYAIGAALSLLQDPAFQSILRDSAFHRAVRRITGPFYLVCGYRDTDSMLVRALSEAGYRSIVIDVVQSRLVALELEDLRLPVPGLCAESRDTEANMATCGTDETLNPFDTLAGRLHRP